MINNESKIINDTINNTDALTVQAGTLSKKKKKKQTPSDRRRLEKRIAKAKALRKAGL